ncbi:hypothetical protein TNIN_131661 [Trichonephila inaurata madagascariensis]|uniref:Uncharacterized protein n=1 Tax=Trichonephila inaurata madagascariensis TaxID=2747483 RepID=A0A8X7C0Q8_9ARAC|nr:hypothetical protein TNIN_30711 [Trichonephila inaurata madagascariensis]GFY71452.1 hypothetical protein TNIN_131661 [Trichonephila inaurata madagascariensis]
MERKGKIKCSVSLLGLLHGQPIKATRVCLQREILVTVAVHFPSSGVTEIEKPSPAPPPSTLSFITLLSRSDFADVLLGEDEKEKKGKKL